MLTISILTLFPDVLSAFLQKSILKQGADKAKVHYNLVDFRQFSQDKYQSVDDHPYGGGAGMLLTLEPLVQAIESSQKQFGPAHKILLTPQGVNWNQTLARSTVTKYQHILLICGHYEGFDERLLDYIDQEISIGPYVLSGGEAAAVVVVDTLVRLLPGVLKKNEATAEETFMEVDREELYQITKDPDLLKITDQKVALLEYPQYTRPEIYQGKSVPEVLLSGDHRRIREWRLSQAWQKTKKRQNNL